MATPRTIKELARWAQAGRFVEDEDDLDDDLDDEFAGLDHGLPIAVHHGAPRALIDPGSVKVDQVPIDRGELLRWAERYGVTERLSDPATVLAQTLYMGDPWTQQTLESRSILDLFSLSTAPLPKSAAQRWQARMRAQQADTIVIAARRYLHEIAQIRAAVASHREALARRAQPPSEPALFALAARIQAARDELAARVPDRALGTYLPTQPAVEEAPLRIEYAEAVNFRLGLQGAAVTIVVEEDPVRARCTCAAGHGGRCAHALAAFDAALALISDPESKARKRLAATLGVPGWQRFLRAFGDELARREPAPPEDVRLAWRIETEDGHLAIAPLLQKRLKGGGFSVGQAIRVDDLRRRRELLADPHDARAFRALTAGLEETHGHAVDGVSRARMARTLEALIGHPRVVLGRGAGAAPRIARERLRVAVEPDDAGVSVSFSLGGRTYRPAELRAASGGGEDLIVVDELSRSIVVCSLDARAQALLAAFEQHPARFPPESHDDLLRGFAALQESVDLAIPEALAGAPVEADARPVLRLGLRDSGELEVDVWVRPAEGGPELRPGEGPETVLHTEGGRRLAARRDRAREVANATAALERLAPAREASGWTFELAEEAALDLIGALREVGDAVVVEWPEPGKKLAITGTALRKELRIRVTDRRDWFGVEGEVEVDGAAIPLAVLLEAVRGGRRYVRVGPGKFAEIEDELRRRMASADDVLHPGRQGLEVALPGVEQIAELVEDPSYLEAASRWRRLRARIDAARSLDPAVPAGLTATLRPYQIEGYKWLSRLAAWGTGACLADDMGLGKTVQTLALLLARGESGPALVIAPTSVGPTWIREAERFAPGLRPRLYRGAERAAQLGAAAPGDLFVTSYALAVRDAEALGKVRFGTLVIDEAQAIKNALTRRARAVRGLDAELRVALTGTPVENHLGELWSLMRVVAPGLLGSWDHFRDRFAGPIERSRDRERSAALARLVRPFLLRRTKAEVAPELPPRTEIERFVDLSAAERWLYDQARRDALESIAAGGGDARFALLAALTRLRRLACHPRLLDDRSKIPSSKLAALVEAVRELREEGHRALVFSQFTTHLALVREALDEAKITYEYLDGSTPSEERTRRIDAFQGGRSDLFLISLKAGGTGLNLTAADYVIHLDPWWNPAVEDQATDRAHRIGQTRAVTVIRLIARGTIEEAVLALHGDKRALAASVFDEDGGTARLSTEELAALIRAGVTDAPAGEDESDAAGDEVEPAGDEVRAGRGSNPPVKATVEEPTQGTSSAAALVSGLLDDLARVRGVADPRYDTTLRAYARSLRRFTEYLATRPELGALGASTIDRVTDEYLAAIREGRWPVPSSQHALARTVTNHLKAFVRAQGRAPRS
jgi:superfamily II DNA or RNA helicase